MTKIFMTGATGFIGQLVAQELVAGGNHVTGLARSDHSAEKLQALGVTPVAGDLANLTVLTNAAEEADAVIHLGFNNDFKHFYRSGKQDVAAIMAFGRALTGTTKPLIVTDGTTGMRQGVLTENSSVWKLPQLMPRRSEYTARKLMERGINALVVRLPPAVHGRGDHGFTRMLVDAAGKAGAARYFSIGRHQWSAVHRVDAAHLYVLAIKYAIAEKPQQRIFNAVAETSVSQQQIAAAIAEKLNVPVKPTANLFSLGNLGTLELFNCPANSTLTRKVLGWRPEQPRLCNDIKNIY